jgi:hypothetical protein
MPYKSKQKNIAPKNDLPQNLAHKPVYALPYEGFDGFNGENTDARFFSVGLAQYNRYEVSVKIFRHTGEKWTRQSEEIPVHRLVDAVTFLAKTAYGAENGKIDFNAETFERQSEDLEITRENRTSDELDAFDRFFTKNENLIKTRFNALYDLLDELKKAGKF